MITVFFMGSVDGSPRSFFNNSYPSTAKEKAMVASMIAVWIFVVIVAFVFLNNGGKNKEYKQREAHWAKFEKQ